MTVEGERIGRTLARILDLLGHLMGKERFPNGRFRAEARRDRAALAPQGGGVTTAAVAQTPSGFTHTRFLCNKCYVIGL